MQSGRVGVTRLICFMMVVELMAAAGMASSIGPTVGSTPTVSELAKILDTQLARIQTLDLQYESTINSLDADGKQILRGEEHYILRVSGDIKYAEKKSILFDDAGEKSGTFEKYALTPEWTKHVVQRESEQVARGLIDPPHRGKFIYFDPVFGVFNFGTPFRSLAENENAEISVEGGMYQLTKRVGTHVLELIVLDPDRGFLPVRHSGFGMDGGSVTMEVVSAVEVEDGLWLPTEVCIKNIIRSHRAAQVEQRFKVTAYAVNEPLSADAFSFMFPGNTDISDNVSGLKYHIDEPADGSTSPPPKADLAKVDPSALQSRPTTDGAPEEAAFTALPIQRESRYRTARSLILVSLGTALIATAGLLKWARNRAGSSN